MRLGEEEIGGMKVGREGGGGRGWRRTWLEDIDLVFVHRKRGYREIEGRCSARSKR